MPKTPASIGQPGLDIIKKFEGCRLRPYLCPSNKLTIGWGHVLVPNWDACLFELEPARLKSIINDCERRRQVTNEAYFFTISQAAADKLLARDASQTALFVHSTTRVPLNQHQFDALCSFVYNVGQGNYALSTLRQKLKAGDYAGAAAELSRWRYGTVNGVKTVLPGLVKRRAAERALFETPEST